MTQQTTPRKSGEAARETLLTCDGKGKAEKERSLQFLISDAVKGSGAVEALEYTKERYVASAKLQGLTPVMEKTDFWRKTTAALKALRALTLPDQPNK